METPKYISKTIQFFKSLNIRTKANTEERTDFELTQTRFGLNLRPASATDKTSNSLLTLMYSEENETLFI